MPVKRRGSKHRGAINQYEAAWLEGGQYGWIVGLNHDDVLQALWDRQGDHDTKYWEPGMHFPRPIAD